MQTWRDGIRKELNRLENQVKMVALRCTHFSAPFSLAGINDRRGFLTELRGSEAF